MNRKWIFSIFRFTTTLVQYILSKMKFDVSAKMKTQVEVTTELPLKYEKYRLYGAEIEFSRGPFGFYLWQHLDTQYYTISQQHFWISRRIRLYPITYFPTVAINCMLTGNVMCVLKGKGKVPLLAGKYGMYYIPAGVRNLAYFSKGFYETIDFEIQEKYLQFFAQDYPILKDMHERMIHADTEGTQFALCDINMNTREQIRKIRNSRSDDPSHRIFLQNRISDIILQYMQSLHRQSLSINLTTGRHGRLMEEISLYIKLNIDQKLTVSGLAKNNNIHPAALEKEFKKFSGQTMKEFIITQRMEAATELLSSTDIPVTEIAYRIGYPDIASFSKAFKLRHLVTPLEYRRKWKDAADKGFS